MVCRDIVSVERLKWIRSGRRELEAVQEVGYYLDWILESPKPVFCRRDGRCLFSRDISQSSDAEMSVFSFFLFVTRSQADVSPGNR